MAASAREPVPTVLSQVESSAEDIVDYTQKENLAEKVARRFGAGAMGALIEFAVRSGLALH